MNYYLAHSGVPGQKPGVQHGPPYPLSAAIRALMARNAADKEQNKKTDSVKKIQSDSDKSSDTNRRVKPSQMTTEELRKRVEKLELEKRYLALEKELHPQKISMGQKLLRDLGPVLAKGAAEALVKGGGMALKAALNARANAKIKQELSGLSDDQLDKRLKRMDMENRYKKAKRGEVNDDDSSKKKKKK